MASLKKLGADFLFCLHFSPHFYYATNTIFQLFPVASIYLRHIFINRLCFTCTTIFSSSLSFACSCWLFLHCIIYCVGINSPTASCEVLSLSTLFSIVILFPNLLWCKLLLSVCLRSYRIFNVSCNKSHSLQNCAYCSAFSFQQMFWHLQNYLAFPTFPWVTLISPLITNLFMYR